ncbi:MAG: carbohydrate binding domain-containing protein, partial [Candidatus Eisenbacteria bacterium]|nr:carbohydrate binding domain-containing protein [Candidatus Eisenbacteria bacterium]
MFYSLLACVVVVASLLPTTTSAIENTPTGFVYPTGTSELGHYAGWLAVPPEYFEDFYHLGTDIDADEGDPVYAIDDGDVYERSPGEWGTGNVALLIRHYLADGTVFLAVYGHITSDLPVGTNVLAGQEIGTIGDYNEADHLHFGIRPGTDTSPPLGRGELPVDPDHEGFVDPIDWIVTHDPGVSRLAEAFTRNGGVATVGNPTGLVYAYGPYLRQDFAGGSYGNCSIMYDPYNQNGNPTATNEAYLLRTGFYQHYLANGGWSVFGCPSRDEYHPETGDPGDAIQFFVRRVADEVQFHYMYFNPPNTVTWHSTYTTAFITQSPDEPIAVEQGATLAWAVQYRNTGTTTWFRDQQDYPYDYMELKSCDASGAVVPSFFYAPGLGWIDTETPCTMQEASVPPGNVASFTFLGKVPPSAPLGPRNVYFRIRHSLAGLLDDWGGMHYVITVVPATPECEPDPGSLLANGSFDGGGCWTIWNRDDSADISFEGALQASVEQGDYDAVAALQLVPLVAGQEYSVSFRAWSSQPDTITVIAQNRQEPWQWYGLWQDVELSSEPQEFWEVFTATETDARARFLIALGAVAGDVWIDDVALRRVECQRQPGVLIGDPAFETLDCWRWQHRAGDRFRIAADDHGNRVACITSSEPDSFWMTQFYQPDIPIEHGKRYLLSQTMETDRPMDIFVAVANRENQVLGAWDSLRVESGGPIPIESMAFTIPEDASTNGAKLVYFLGKSAGTCKIGQPLLQELHCELDPGGMIGDGDFEGRDCWIFQHRMLDRFTVERDADGRMAGHVFASADSDSVWVTQIRQENFRLRKDMKYYLHAEVKTTTPGGRFVAGLTIPGRRPENWNAVFRVDTLSGLNEYYVIDTLLTPPADSDSALLSFAFGRTASDNWIRDVRLEERDNCFREPGNLVASPGFEKAGCWRIPAGSHIEGNTVEIDVSREGGDPWSVTLGQDGIVLANRWRYRLTFTTSCNRPTAEIAVHVGSPGENILEDGRIQIQQGEREYFLNGLATESTYEAVLEFGFGIDAARY